MNPTTQTVPSVALRADKAIALADRQVVKRDGSIVRFELSKIVRAIALAINDVRAASAPNLSRDDALACYGVNPEFYSMASKFADGVSRMLEIYYRVGRSPTIEEVQDAVENAIALEGYWDVARGYMLYRERQADKRVHKYEYDGLSDYVATSKYARYIPALGRRESFAEGVNRVRDMHLSHFGAQVDRVLPQVLPADVVALAGEHAPMVDSLLAGRSLRSVIHDAFVAVGAKKVMPSMRSMQFGGEAILKNNARLYNCAFSNVDRVSFFKEYMFLLLAGTGCGFSVQKHHIAMLPEVKLRGDESDLAVVHHICADSIEGWGDALGALMQSYFEGHKVEFSYAQIRKKGALLKTSGGKAPGHLPLKKALTRAEVILEGSAGRKLRPIEVYDILMHVARAVLSGGNRRSATIALFSPDDEEMMNAKTGDWYKTHPYRSASNNSAVLTRSENNEAIFKRLFEAQKSAGEPGFYFCENPDAGCNPCVEIALFPLLVNPTPEEVSKLLRYGYQGELPGMINRLSGWQMCNLSTINAAAVTTPEDFYRACIQAAFLGTIQATYTDIPYLGPVTRVINERDALLGVSICGLMDNPGIFFNPEILRAGAHLCCAVNQFVAEFLGINPAARVTCVKPEGTTSLLLNASSGISPHHARRYFRRVQANRSEGPFSYLKRINPQMTERSLNPEAEGTDDVITFPIEAPAHAILRKDLTGVQFLEKVKLVQQNWVVPGASAHNPNPELCHNVSNTVNVGAKEWDAVRDFIWFNRAGFTGIALLGEHGDKGYVQAPREEVVTEADIAKWNALKPQPMDFTQFKEDSDETELNVQAPACAGGQCDLGLMRASRVA